MSRILLRRGNKVDLPALNVGEPGFSTDTKELFIGHSSGNQRIPIVPSLSAAPWITPTLFNGWVNYGSGQASVGYYKDDLGVVHIKGFIKNGVTTGGNVIFSLPAGYRPLEILTYSTASNGAYGQTYVKDTGDVVFDAGSNVFFSLNIPSFRAEQ
jgi:hypothetical protein